MSDGFFTCGTAPIGVGPRVFSQVDLMNDRVDGLLDSTMTLVNNLAAYNIANVNFEIDPANIQQVVLQVVNESVDLADVPIVAVGSIPDPGPVTATAIPLPSDPPAPPADPPPIDVPPAPAGYTPVFGPAPVLVDPPPPPSGDPLDGILPPDLLGITLPAPPDVDFGIPFTAVPPVFNATPPDPADFNYTEQAYSPLLVDEIKAVLQSMFAGTSGLPAVVENALWQREAEREAEKAAAAVQDAFDEMATRGFTLPNGPLQAKLAQVRQNNQNQANSLGRDVMIRVHEVIVEQLKFAVAQGITLEDTWIKLYSDIQNRRLQAAQVAVNIAISVYNALVAQYSAAAEVYKVAAEVYSTQIQAELAKLQGYSEQLRAQGLIVNINQQNVAIYSARVDAAIKAYLGEIQAFTALIDAEKVKLDTYRVSIEVEQAKLQAVQQELNIWSGEIQAQNITQQAYATRSQTYATTVQAWKAEYEATIEQQRGALALLEAETQRYTARIQGVVGTANANVANAQAVTASNANVVQKYVADIQGASAYNQALIEKIKAINDANLQNTQLFLKNGEINAQNGLAAQQMLERAIEAAVQVMAQMTASFASSVNLSGQASDSTSFQQSCSYQTSQTFSGD